MKIGIFSFFSGIGFLDLGFETNPEFEVVFSNEIHAPFLEGYKSARKELNIKQPRFGYFNDDINILLENPEIISSHIKEAKKSYDLIGFIGGPPCPDFSVGGKNKGRNGDNGKLSQTYIDLIKLFKPDFFLFENVKGLWRTKKHRKFYEELKSTLVFNQYDLTEKLVNSLEYGVPQDRDRIILIGFQNNFLTENNHKLQDLFNWDTHIKYQLQKTRELSWPQTTEFKEDTILTKPSNIHTDLTVQYWFDKNNVSSHDNAPHHFQPRAGLKKFLIIEEGDDSKKSYKRLHRWRYSPTAAYGNNEVHLHPYKPRRISVAEALAIQSLPKDFILPDTMSLTNMFKAIGNGVPYLLSYGLAKTISSFIQKNYKIVSKAVRA